MPPERLVTKNFVLSFICNLITGFVFYLFMTTMAQYAIVSFMASASVAGLAASIFVIGAIGGRIITGTLGARFTRKRIAACMLALFFGCSLLYFPKVSIVFLLLVRFVQGIGFGASNTAIQSIALSSLPQGRHAEGTNTFSLSATAGTALGPLFGLTIIHNVSYEVLFVLAAAISALACIACCLIADVPQHTTMPASAARLPHPKPESCASQPKGIWVIMEKKVLVFGIMTFFMGLAYSTMTAFINSFGIDEGYGDYTAYMFGMYFIGLVILRPIAGRIMDRHGDNIVMIPALVVFALTFVVLAAVKDQTMLLLVGVLMAAGFGVLLSAGQSVCNARAGKAAITKAIATYYMFLDAGTGIGPYISGLALPLLGYRTLFLCWGIVAALLIVYYYLIHGRYAKTTGFH